MKGWYRPEISPSSPPSYRAREMRRARLFAGGTYFRTKEPSRAGNKISIQALEFDQDGVKVGKLIVTNHNTLIAENVIGPAVINILVQELNWNERFIIDQLTTVPRIRKFRMSFQTTPMLTPEQDLGTFVPSQLFHIPSKLSVKLSLVTSEITPESVITIKPRTRVYDLVIAPSPPPPSGGDEGGNVVTPIEPGWDIAALREQVNANDPWIEMLPRSGTPKPSADPSAPPPEPLAEKFDVQDDGVDDDYLTPFPDTFMEGADGLPDYPTPWKEGFGKFMMHVAASEQPNGVVEDTYDMYEWIGESPMSGVWKKF